MVSSSLSISLSLSIISILSAEKWYQYGLSEECHHTGAYPNSTALTNHALQTSSYRSINP